MAESAPTAKPGIDEDELGRVRRRIERDADRRVEIERHAMLRDFIEVIDDLERALAASGGDEVTSGVEMVRDRFLAKLSRYGVERQADAAGHPFDPKRHEAIGTAGVEPSRDGRIVEVLQPAYVVDDELLRPAQVIVGRASS